MFQIIIICVLQGGNEKLCPVVPAVKIKITTSVQSANTCRKLDSNDESDLNKTSKVKVGKGQSRSRFVSDAACKWSWLNVFQFLLMNMKSIVSGWVYRVFIFFFNCFKVERNIVKLIASYSSDESTMWLHIVPNSLLVISFLCGLKLFFVSFCFSTTHSGQNGAWSFKVKPGKRPPSKRTKEHVEGCLGSWPDLFISGLSFHGEDEM